jgi:hypothetical protein
MRSASGYGLPGFGFGDPVNVTCVPGGSFPTRRLSGSVRAAGAWWDRCGHAESAVPLGVIAALFGMAAMLAVISGAK